MRLNKSIVAGHIVVSFDHVINGFLSVVMAPLFFGASENPILQLLFSYAAFSAGYVAGPIGAIAFGRLGDKYGRKKMLLASILGIGIPILLIGLLPTYKVIGTAAPIMLVFLRVIYGFFRGSEYAGVLIHNHETGNKNPRSASSIMSYGTMGGCLAATVCFFITQEEAPSWFWRIPYIAGGMSALVIFLLRRKIPETHEYMRALEEKLNIKSPIKELVKNYRLEFAAGVAISASYLGVAYSSMIFGNRLFQQAGSTVQQSMLFSIFDLLWLSISIMIMGKIADKIGMKKLLKYGLITIITSAFPLCALISGEMTIIKIYVYMILVTFFSASITSCSATYIANLFNVSCRYSGFAITDSVGGIIGGGTPFMMLLFSSLFKSNLGCVAWFYILTIPTLALICIVNKRIIKKNAEFFEK